MMDRETPSTLETLTGLAVLAAVLAQTWIILQEATQGDAGRWAKRWWHRDVRPFVVRIVTWLDAKAVTERMLTEEIEPLLRGQD